MNSDRTAGTSLPDRRVGRRRYADLSRPEPEPEPRLAAALHDARQQAVAIQVLLARMDEQDQPEMRHKLDQLGTAAGQLLEVLENAADPACVKERIAVWDGVRDLVETARARGAASVETVVDPTVLVLASPALLRRAVGNLLDNAARAAGDRGRIRLSIVAAGAGGAGVVVEDSGPGFGAAPPGRSSIGLGVVLEFIGSAHGALEVGRSDLGGALVRLSVPTSTAAPTAPRPALVRAGSRARTARERLLEAGQ